MPSLIIKSPNQGIAQSPHVGFAEVVNLDITTIPGITKLNTIMSKQSGTTVVGQINWFVRDPSNTNKIYAVDNAGQVYVGTYTTSWAWATVAGETAGGHGNGLMIWKDYLFVARDAYLDVYGPLSGSPSWSNSWKAIDSDVLWHPMLISKNDSKLYGGAGRFVFSLEENSGQTFAPGTPASFTWTQQALDLPVSYRIKCIEELGNNLILGTWQGTNIYDIRVADIFPWDRSSASFGQPIILDEFGVHAMKNIGNILIVLAGIGGTIFRSDGVNAIPIGQMPQDLTGGKYLEWYPGAICSYKNKIFFGVGNGGTTAISGMGVYSLFQTGRGNVLNLEHQISTLSTGASNPLKVSALLPISRDTIQIGWRDNVIFGIDLSSSTSFAFGTDYSGYFVTPLFTVGSNLNEYKFSQIEFNLARPLRTTEGIKLEYRKDLTADFTTIGTFNYATWGAILSKNIVAEISNEIKSCEQIQFKISLNGSSTTSPELKSISLK